MLELKINKNNYKQIITLLKGIAVAISICTVFGLTTSNILYLIVALFFILLIDYKKSYDKDVIIVSKVMSGLFSLFLIISKFENVLAIEYLVFWPISVLVCFLGMYWCFNEIISRLVFNVLQIEIKNLNMERHSFQYAFMLAFAFLSMMTIISMAISFPGNNTRDSIGYLDIAFNNEEMMAAAPIIYIMFIKETWQLGYHLFHSANAAFATCIIIQTLFLIIIESWVVARLYMAGVKKIACILILLFYGIVPYNLQLPHTMWKDIPFSIFVLLLTTALWKACDNNKSTTKTKIYSIINTLVIIIAATGMALMRANGYYAFIFMIPFVIICFWKSDKKIVFAIILSFILVRIIQGPVYDNVMSKQLNLVEEKKENNINKQKIDNSVSIESNEYKQKEIKNVMDGYNVSGFTVITIQQLARVAVDIPNLTKEDYERLNKILDVEKVKEIYNPYCRDDAAKTMRMGMSSDYVKEWLYFGLKYPIQYILAYRDQTFGYYYPDIQYWVYTDQIQENLTEKYGVYKDSVLDDDQRYEVFKFEESYKNIPLYGMIWSIGFMVWLAIFTAAVVYCRKNRRLLIVYTPVLGVWLTLLVATPVYAEFRYIYSLFLCMPIFLSIMFMAKSNKTIVCESNN